jgi:site-specific recombinase XerD
MEYCADEDITLVSVYNEVCSVRGMKEHKKSILYMTNEAIETLLKTPSTDTVKGRRNRMLLIMLYDTAARAQELVDITLRDLHIVNVKSPFVTLTGKGNKSRNVPLMEKTVAHIKNYLQEFHPHPSTDGKDPLFSFEKRRETSCLIYRYGKSTSWLLCKPGKVYLPPNSSACPLSFS